MHLLGQWFPNFPPHPMDHLTILMIVLRIVATEMLCTRCSTAFKCIFIASFLYCSILQNKRSNNNTIRNQSGYLMQWMCHLPSSTTNPQTHLSEAWSMDHSLGTPVLGYLLQVFLQHLKAHLTKILLMQMYVIRSNLVVRFVTVLCMSQNKRNI